MPILYCTIQDANIIVQYNILLIIVQYNMLILIQVVQYNGVEYCSTSTSIILV